MNATTSGDAIHCENAVISHSWRRCAELHHIDPDGREPPRILGESALRLSKEPLESALRAAQPELDRL